MGLVVAFLAAYLSCAELCEAAYKRSVLPSGHWPSTDLAATTGRR